MKNKFVFSMLFLGLGVILSSCNNDRKSEESTTVETTTETTTETIEKTTTTDTVIETTTKTIVETTTETVVETTTEPEETSSLADLPWV